MTGLRGVAEKEDGDAEQYPDVGELGYFLARQMDLGRVAGFGVIDGLTVSVASDRARTVTIEAGHGLTPSGSHVMLPERLDVDLAAVSETQLLDARFGISSVPKAPPHNRSGLYIIAQRAVEYTDHPITAYPTHLDAPRAVHDGSVIQATAITLIPYPDAGGGSELGERRRHVVREIFLDEGRKGQPEQVLPLAMLAMERGVMRWLDMFLVRREIGHREREVWGLGLSPRPLRAAHLRQYGAELEEIEARAGRVERVSAGDYFSVLPPAGPMPVTGISGDGFTHTFFPAEMDVELSMIPDDELPALIEDSLLLPALDLELSGDAQESTSVMVLLPVPRHELRVLDAKLESRLRVLPAARPDVIAKRRPITTLTQLSARRVSALARPAEVSADSVWREQLAGASQLWYVRRRNLHYKVQVASVAVSLVADEVQSEAQVEERIRTASLVTRFNSLLNRSTRTGMTTLVARPVLREGSDLVLKSAVAELESRESLRRLDVMQVSTRFAGPSFGEGVARLQTRNEAFTGNTRLVNNLSKSARLPELDRLARSLSDAELDALGEELEETGSGTGDEPVKQLTATIDAKLSGVSPIRSQPVLTRPVR